MMDDDDESSEKFFETKYIKLFSSFIQSQAWVFYDKAY